MSIKRKAIVLLWRIKIWLLGPSSTFKVGDTVQLKKGDQLMVVIEVCRYRKMKHCILYCEWYESEFHRTRRNLFSERAVKYFDWYAALPTAC